MVNFDRLLNYILIVLVMLSLLFSVSCVASISNMKQQVNDIGSRVVWGWKLIDEKIDDLDYKLENAINAGTSSIIDAVDTNANKIINKKGSISFGSSRNYYI